MGVELKWYAAHVVAAEHGAWKMAAVAVSGGRVVGLKQFLNEPPNTIWLGGTIELRYDPSGQLLAYHVESNKILV